MYNHIDESKEFFVAGYISSPEIVEVEPTYKEKYGDLVKKLAMIKTFASGILVPKDYATTLVSDAHKEDGVVSEFPGCASNAIVSLAQSPNPSPKVATTLVISYNGASIDYPGCTDLAYKKAITDGAGIIDCNVQMSKDGVAFCLDSADLHGKTNAAMAFMDRSTSIPEIQPKSGVFTFDVTWTEIKYVKPKYAGKFLTLPKFLKLAKKNASTVAILIGIQNAAYLASKKGQPLEKGGLYLHQVTKPIGDAPKPVTDDIKKYADAVNVVKKSVVEESKIYFSTGLTKVIDEMHGISQSGIDGVITDYPKTASAFMRNPCVDANSTAPFVFMPIKPGDYLAQVEPAVLPPASAPIPPLQVTDVIDPPLPPVNSGARRQGDPRAENERPIVTVANIAHRDLLPTSVVVPLEILSARNVEPSGLLQNLLKQKVPKPKRSKKKRVVYDSEGLPITAHPPKRLRADYGTTGGSVTGGKSPSVLNRLLQDSRLTVEQGAKSADPEVDSLVRSAAPVMTEAITVATVATTVAIPADVSKDKSAPHPSVFGSSSSSDKRFNVSTGNNNLSLSSEVRMRAEYNILEKRKWRSLAEEKNTLLEAKDKEIEDLKSQLLRAREESAEGRPNFRVHRPDDADFTRVYVRFSESFHPATTVSLKRYCGAQWFTNSWDKLLVVKCLNSNEYMEALGHAFGRAIEKGMQEGLAAGIEHGQAGRCLTDLELINPSSEDEFEFCHPCTP
ncbi:glycerophosphodiester phosphodiesterase GDPDL7 [Tanacetum coccineum]